MSPAYVAWAVFHMRTGVRIQFSMSRTINLHCSCAKYSTTGIMVCLRLKFLFFHCLSEHSNNSLILLKLKLLACVRHS